MDTHPAGRETDPLFSSAQQMRQGAVEDVKRGAGRVSVDEATAAWTTPHDEQMMTSPTALVASPPALSSATEYPFVPAPTARRLSSMRRSRRSSASPRRSSTLTGRRPRAPSRTESGRDFLGLPEAPTTDPESLSDQAEEDEESSSDEEEDEEWVGPICAAPSDLLTETGIPPLTPGPSFYSPPTIRRPVLDPHASLLPPHATQAFPRRTSRQSVYDGPDVERVHLHRRRHDPAVAGDARPDEAVDAGDHECRAVQ